MFNFFKKVYNAVKSFFCEIIDKVKILFSSEPVSTEEKAEIKNVKKESAVKVESRQEQVRDCIIVEPPQETSPQPVVEYYYSPLIMALEENKMSFDEYVRRQADVLPALVPIVNINPKFRFMFANNEDTEQQLKFYKYRDMVREIERKAKASKTHVSQHELLLAAYECGIPPQLPVERKQITLLPAYQMFANWCPDKWDDAILFAMDTLYPDPLEVDAETSLYRTQNEYLLDIEEMIPWYLEIYLLRLIYLSKSKTYVGTKCLQEINMLKTLWIQCNGDSIVFAYRIEFAIMMEFLKRGETHKVNKEKMDDFAMTHRVELPVENVWKPLFDYAAYHDGYVGLPLVSELVYSLNKFPSTKKYAEKALKSLMPEGFNFAKCDTKLQMDRVFCEYLWEYSTGIEYALELAVLRSAAIIDLGGQGEKEAKGFLDVIRKALKTDPINKVRKDIYYHSVVAALDIGYYMYTPDELIDETIDYFTNIAPKASMRKQAEQGKKGFAKYIKFVNDDEPEVGALLIHESIVNERIVPYPFTPEVVKEMRKELKEKTPWAVKTVEKHKAWEKRCRGY